MNLVFVPIKGGLGNQLFTFLSAYSYAKKYNKKVVILKSWFNGYQRGWRFNEFRRVFLLDQIIDKKYFIKLPLSIDFLFMLFLRTFRKINFFKKFILEETSPNFDTSFFRPNYLVLDGYFQSEKYFHPSIKRCFLKPNISIHNYPGVSKRYNNTKRLVAIHVRRDDSVVKGSNMIGILDIAYYEKAVRVLGKKDKFIFLIFSDSPEWCKKQNFFNEIDSIFINEPDPVRTLLFMSCCDDFIIAGSTLSWWGAWLSSSHQKKILAPYPFFENRDLKFEKDLIPSKWIRVNSIFTR
jgi:hypothetical protein